MSIDAMKHYEAALKAAFPQGASGEVFEHWNKARLAIEQAERQESYWQEEARRYAGNADFWREKAKRQPMVVSQECAERGCMAHDDRVDGPGVVIEPQEKQEPVAWEDVLGAIARGWAYPENAQKPMDVQLAVAIAKEIQDMYTTPPAAQRQPLTDEEIRKFADTHLFYQPEGYEVSGIFNLARAIERAHGIGGGE